MSSEIFDSLDKDFLDYMAGRGFDHYSKLLLNLPKSYKDFRTPDKSIRSALSFGKSEGDYCLIRVKLKRKPGVDFTKKPAMVKAQVTDGADDFRLVRFGNTMSWRFLKEGDLIYVYGQITLDEYQGMYVIKQPVIVDGDFVGRFYPEYSSKGKEYSGEYIEGVIKLLIESCLPDIEKYICESIGYDTSYIARIVSNKFKNVADIIKNVHFPVDIESLKDSKKSIRMLNAMHAVLMLRDEKERPGDERSYVHCPTEALKTVAGSLPFDLMKDQKKAIWDVVKGLGTRSPIDHLIYGDVGCGKTVSYLVPVILAYLAGKQCIIMTPNSLLSKQISGDIEGIAKSLSHIYSIESYLIQGVISKSYANSIDLLRKPILVGTSSLIKFLEKKERDGEYNGAEVVVFDEQQKLGSSQKETLIKPFTNIIESTATPIPKTVALSLFGSKSVSYIETSPVEKNITSSVLYPSDKKRVFSELKDIISSGYQVAIICPNRTQVSVWFDMSIYSESDPGDIKKILSNAGCKRISIEQTKKDYYKCKFAQNPASMFEDKVEADKILADISVLSLSEVDGKENKVAANTNVENVAKMWEEIFPGGVVYIHGGMKPEEKLNAMEKTHSLDCKVLVSSSVIEVGLTFPRLRAVVVQSSENLGISPLHQIRGRIARHGGDGYFYMGVQSAKGSVGEKTMYRIEVLQNETKGSRLAELDMLGRGIGDIGKYSVLQAGHYSGLMPTLKVTPDDLAAFMRGRKQSAS